jgi:hypothetical protein
MITYSAKAEYGRTSGAQIEMITRSGTNQFHGGLSEYLRNRLLDANDFFNNATGIVRPKLVYNGFGATLGGPVRRNRTFFLASYQGIREAFDAVRNQSVLTDQAKSGVFRWRSADSPDIQQFNIASNDPRHLGIDPVVAATLRLLPPPNNFDIGDGLNNAGFRFNDPASLSRDTYLIRADHRLSNAATFFFRLMGIREDVTDIINGAARVFQAIFPE